MIGLFRERFARGFFKSKGLWLFAVIVFGLSPLFAQPNGPNPVLVDQVTAFYRFHFAHDMRFTRATVKARSAWLTPGLLKICAVYFANPDAPDQVPAIDGDPFTNSQEYPNSFEVGTSKQSKFTALVSVSFRWPDGRKRSLSLTLVEQKRKWLIDDVRYPDGTSLRSLISESKP